MRHSRRQILQLGAALLATPASAAMRHGAMPAHSPAPVALSPATKKIVIGPSVLEVGRDSAISTTTYNGTFPGPLLRLTEGKRVSFDIVNTTDVPEQLHWHGQFLPTSVDGAAEEGTPFIPPHGSRRVSFVPGPTGFRFFHTHVTALNDLSKGFYSGQVGLVYIEPKREPGAYDREVFLTLKEFGPSLNHIEMMMAFMTNKTALPALQAIDRAAVNEALKQGRQPLGYELAYSHFTINGKPLGQGEPIRVRPGQRVLFHILNASASEIRSLALPGHVFRVAAMDGNPVPNPAAVPVLWIGPGERISAIVEMKAPGVWVLGDLDIDARSGGMGIVVEYAGKSGSAVWKQPAPFAWDYRRFGRPGGVAQKPDEEIELTFATRYATRFGFNEFTVNGVPFSMEKMEPKFRLRFGKRYRLKLRNATDDVHPLHLHRHSFELSSIAGAPTSGIIKDVAMIGAFQEMTVDFTANQRGLSLFHCHMQSHMDFGFMALFDCA